MVAEEGAGEDVVSSKRQRPCLRVEDKVKIGISSCLLGYRFRWNADHKHDQYLTDTLDRFVEYVPVCPEVEAGFGVPRESFRLFGDPENPRLIAFESGTDHTDLMIRWAKNRVMELEKENLCGETMAGQRCQVCKSEKTGKFSSTRRQMLWVEDIGGILTRGRQSTDAFCVDIAASKLYTYAYEQKCFSGQGRPIYTLFGDAVGRQYRCSEDRVPRVYANRFGRAAFLSCRFAHHYLGVRKSDTASARTA